jgi:hypothetical protein
MDGRIVGELCDAITDAFTPDTLRQLLRIKLNKQLDALTASGNFRAVVFELVETADREGWVNELVSAALEANPGNTALQQFAKQFRGEAAHVAKRPPTPAAGEEERVRLLVHVQDDQETGPALVASVYNYCLFTIAIRGVFLHCREPKTNDVDDSLRGMVTFFFAVEEKLPDFEVSIDLLPHREVRFIMHGRLHKPFFEGEPRIGQDSWVGVCSHFGEIARFEGEDLMWMLRNLVDFLRRNRGFPQFE